ncbi:putative histone-lysine N-methyltransferase 1 [Manduca sexta]|uniref:putative histone-lysine N-methyltransferase 1 n=1 Tax=Manduca sexta TaxID=7130 RepID=UPI001890AF40|nr:putative histone-lysine N-methyltransferase 1 [Manduca sexta]
MWSSDSDLELLDMLSDWSDLSSDEDSKESFERALDYTSGFNKNAPEIPDDMSLYDEDDAPSLPRDLQPKGEDSLFNEYQCNVCNKTITDFRYTCVQCSNLDLCGACEANRAHHHHYVLRIPAPKPFTEVQFVLATIRRHLMKRLDPIMEPGQDRDDVISVKSEIKVEFESYDDFENNEEENNGDDENSDDENSDEDGNSDDYDDHSDFGKINDNGEVKENVNIVDVHIENTSPSENTLDKSETIVHPESETVDTRESSESIIIKVEPESERVQGQLVRTEASSATSVEASPASSTDASTRVSHASSTDAPPPATAPVASKRKILIKRSDIINVKDFASPAKLMCVGSVSSHEVNDAEETVTLVFPDDQPPQLQPPETGQE